MPTTENEQRYLFQRSIPVEEGYDLVVAGGGPAGSAAAICAARLGAKVLLVEGTGCLGGMGTSALVSAWSDLGDGHRMIVGGIMAELLETLYQRGYYKPNVKREHWKQLHGGFGYSSEGLKLVLDELCQKAGVEIRFFTRVIDADVSGRKINGVVINNIEDHHYVKARAFIDATGDAVLSKLCGVQYREAGRDTKNIMAPTLCAIQTGIDGETYDQQSKWPEPKMDADGNPLPLQGYQSKQQEAIFQAIADGFFSQPDRHIPGLFRSSPTTAIMNAGHLFGTNATKCRSLSDAMIRGRQLAQEYSRFFQKYIRGCENMQLVTTAALLGVRESRRIVGEYELDYDDFIHRRSFPDQIAIYNKAVDIHVYDCSEQEWERHKQEFIAADRPAAGEFYGLPYGMLVPQGMENLWVAGRCNSSDVKVHGAIRDQPACFMMGQAAGTAATQFIKTGQPAYDLDTRELVHTLREAGAYLPQESLSRQMTRKAPSKAEPPRPTASPAATMAGHSK